ncbi:pentapeptide repeat-containing protein [Streptomyces sp. Tu102]|uniref:pentapeptide repeat-containing protein n=1 Tax=Streptomyces TaxID=1883 RepID=UPI002029C925|nr:pentapeptide repeat-containing protein [Streptomyces sp. Tu102]
MDWARRTELASVLLTSLAAVAALWYSNVQTEQATEQARQDRALTKDAQVTDRYTAAVTNLGSDKMDVRLGGVYALQRIMQDSTRDHPTIANVLNTYTRTHANRPPAKGQDIPADVQAALTVLTTRNTAHDQGFVPDLSNAWLPKADIHGSTPTQGAHLVRAHLASAHLNGADLRGADLRGADLRYADLEVADLRGADLKGARLWNADLSVAGLIGANLSGAELGHSDLTDAYLEDADLAGANLEDADLRGADLKGVENFSKEQLELAVTDEDTKLPAGLR